MRRLLLILAVLGVVPGCSQLRKIRLKSLNREPIFEQQKTISDSFDNNVIKEQEAKLNDIPVPIDAQPIRLMFSKDSHNENSSLGYAIPLQLQELKQFYLQEMERFGWKTYCFMDGVEQLMVFEKPTRICAISIRPQPENNSQQKTTLLIFVTTR